MTYNSRENVDQKLNMSSNGWTESGTYTFDKDGKTTLKFAGVNKAIFADQLFVLEGVDGYGYKFMLYFTLKKDGNALPELEKGSYVFTEGESFDIGAIYDDLSVTRDDSNESATVTNATTRTPKAPQGTTYTMVNLKNIEAWEYSEEKPDDYHWTTDDLTKKYDHAPVLDNVKVTGYKLVDPTGKVVSTQSLTGTIITNDARNNGRFTIPTIDGKWFGTAQAVELTMIIELTYEDGTTTEIYQVSTKVTLKRAIEIKGIANNAVRDGVEFAVAGQFGVKLNGADLTSTTTYLNDTLVVCVNANSTATFTLTYGEGDGAIIKNVKLPNTGWGIARIFYVSLSEQLGVMLTKGDKIEIDNVANVDWTSYRYYDGAEHIKKDVDMIPTDGGTLSIGELQTDCIYLEHSSLLESENRHKETKYYIAQVDTNSDGTADCSYRISREYFVTGYYYQLEPNYANEVGNVLNIIKIADDNYVSSDWRARAFTLYEVEVTSENSRTPIALSDEDYSRLRFYIVTKGDSQYGKVESVNELDGEITFNAALGDGEHIEIRVEMVVSGADRDYSNTADESRRVLGTLKLGKAPSAP